VNTPATPQLVLASSSPYRRILLERLIRNFRQDSPDLDESGLPTEPVEARVTRLAVEKAEAVAKRHAGALVIGCDQLAACEGMVLGKPGTHARAFAQLSSVSGCSVGFHTAVVYWTPVNSGITGTWISPRCASVSWKRGDRALSEY